MTRPWSACSQLLALVLGLAACSRDAPTEPSGAVPGPDNRRVELAGFVVALEDVQSRILPTLGHSSTVEALAETLGEVERALSGGEAARVEEALARANASAMGLRADTAFLPDLDVVQLVLDQIAVTARGPSRPPESQPNQPLPRRRAP